MNHDSKRIPRRLRRSQRVNRKSNIILTMNPPRGLLRGGLNKFAKLFEWINANWAVLGIGFSLLGILAARLLFDVSVFQPLEEIAAKQAEYRERQQKIEHQKIMVDRHLTLGNQFLSNDRYAAAKIEFNQVLKLDQVNPVAQMGLFKTGVFEALMDQEYIPEVVECQIHFILEENPNDPHALVMYGNLYAQLAEYDNAKEQYELALKSAEKPASAYFNLGVLFEKEKKLDLAVNMYEKAVVLSKWNERYLNNLASVYCQKKDYQNAIKTYQQVLMMDYEYLLPCLEISLAYRFSGDLNLAASYQEKLSIQLDDKTLTGLRKNKDVWFFKAQQRSVKFYSIKEKKVYVLYTLSGTHYILGQKEKAENYVNMAETISVDNMESIKRLVSWDLKRLAEKNRNYLPIINEFIEDFF